MQQNNEIFEKYLQRISNILMINGSVLPNPSINGKMGVSVFFFHYARHTGNSVFNGQALDLIEEIQQQIHLDSPVNYQSGLAGIGAGIEYLAQNSFLEIDTDEILEDFDQRIIQDILCKSPGDFSLQTGLTGLCRYFFFRIKNQSSGNKVKSSALKCFAFYLDQLNRNKILEIENTGKYLHDILSLLCDLYSFSELRDHVNHCISQIARCPFEKIPDSDLPYRIPAFLKMSRLPANFSTGDVASKIERVLKSPVTFFPKTKSVFGITKIEFWIWLLRCKNCLSVQEDNNSGVIQQIINKEEEMVNVLSSNFETRYKEGDSLGIRGGMTGMGLLLLSASSTDSSSWLSLL